MHAHQLGRVAASSNIGAPLLLSRPDVLVHAEEVVGVSLAEGWGADMSAAVPTYGQPVQRMSIFREETLANA
jgi:hypothetical protein